MPPQEILDTFGKFLEILILQQKFSKVRLKLCREKLIIKEVLKKEWQTFIFVS